MESTRELVEIQLSEILNKSCRMLDLNWPPQQTLEDDHVHDVDTTLSLSSIPYGSVPGTGAGMESTSENRGSGLSNQLDQGNFRCKLCESGYETCVDGSQVVLGSGTGFHCDAIESTPAQQTLEDDHQPVFMGELHGLGYGSGELEWVRDEEHVDWSHVARMNSGMGFHGDSSESTSAREFGELKFNEILNRNPYMGIDWYSGLGSSLGFHGFYPATFSGFYPVDRNMEQLPALSSFYQPMEAMYNYYFGNIIGAHHSDNEIEDSYMGDARYYATDSEIEDADYDIAMEDDDWERRLTPAAVRVVENLPLVRLSKMLVCGVCGDEIEEGQIVNELPCCHCFHQDCIVPWLRRTNTCPFCRYKLPTE